jgi:hypothetical protein
MNNTELHVSNTTTSPTSRGRRAWLFTRHYLEMVVAMILGMVILGPVWSWLTMPPASPLCSTGRMWPPWSWRRT